MAVSSSMIPATGVPMPFISYGGTSIVVSLCMVGILLNISRKRIKKIKSYEARRKYIKFYFYKNGLLICESGLLKLRFLAPWQRPHYSRRFYGFDSRTDAKKILLLNPVPFEFYYWNTETSRLTFGGNGDSFFGYTAYTGTGFINMLSRTK